MAVICAVLVIASLVYGPVRISLSDLWAAATGASSEPASTILTQLRMPRVVLALLVGGSLALSGAALQGVLRNPLADPGLIGIAAGAGVGAVGFIVLGDALLTLSGHSAIMQILQPYLLSIFAFLGAAIATFFVFYIARGPNGISVTMLILAGVAVSAVAGAFIGAMVYISDDRQLRDLTFWSMGSLGDAQWTRLVPVAVFALPAWFILAGTARPLDLFQLGERAAFHAGINTNYVKFKIGAASALAVGAVTAVAGPIGFIGLVAPHLSRMLIGPRHAFILPGAVLIGAALTLFSDLAVRTIAPPAEPPIGLATSMIGGPFFLWLIAARARSGHA
ncbi:MAG: iron ABC transporter permease [Pseudomonadota bacterium]